MKTKQDIVPEQFFEPADATLIRSAKAAWEKLGGQSFAYKKHDGWRLQIHVTGKEVKIFSRHEVDYTAKFPQIVQIMQNQLDVETVILDTEVVGYDSMGNQLPPTLKSFRLAAQIKCWILDLLYLNGESLIALPTTERLQHLCSWFSPVNDQLQIVELHEFKTSESWEAFFNQCVREGYEGAILKKKNAGYETTVGKVRLYDTVDLVVVAAEYELKTLHRFKKVLCAAKCMQTGHFLPVAMLYKTDPKTNNNEAWAEMERDLLPRLVSRKPDHVISQRYHPSCWFSPGTIIEIKGRINQTHFAPFLHIRYDGNRGIGYHQAELLRIREDKGLAHIDSLTKIADRNEIDLSLPLVAAPPQPIQRSLFD